MLVQQFFVKGLAHSSYLLAGAKTCAIIDPRRDIQIYLDAAKQLDVRITHILETHLHADFISGHLDLEAKTGAQIYAPKSAHCAFTHAPVAEGDTFQLEDMKITVLETPGHTPEHISYVVTDSVRGDEPVAVFCGDTLFVGDVGRPDLFPGRAEELAEKLYYSIHEKLLKLPDFCEVYPAHGAGSLCGRAMGAKRATTIGYEKLYNKPLLITSKKDFIESLTTAMPAAPDHFTRCSAINGAGPKLVASLPSPKALSPLQFNDLIKKNNSLVLDIRSYESFGGKHIPGAYNIDFGGNFATFCGWILPHETDILLVAHSPELVHEAVPLLHRVGLDNVIGYLEGGMYEWAKNGLPLEHVPQMSVHTLFSTITQGKSITIVDVRAPAEFNAFHIKGAINIPAPDIRHRYTELFPEAPIVIICGTGHRSSMACSMLKQKGISNVINLAGGMVSYMAAGYAPECPVCLNPHGPSFLGMKRNFIMNV